METTVVTSATTQLLQMGLAGLVIIGLAVVVYVLYKQVVASNKAAMEDMKERQSRMIEVIERNTAALDKHSEVVAKVVEANKRPRKGESP